MRTPKQGQAAVLGERERRRRQVQMPVLHEPGPWENILWTVTNVERYPDVPAVSHGRGYPVLPWALNRAHMVFSFIPKIKLVSG